MHTLLDTLVHTTWQASLLILLVLLVQILLGRRLAPRWRHALWLIVLVRLAMPIVPASPMSVFNFIPRSAVERPQATIDYEALSRVQVPVPPEFFANVRTERIPRAIHTPPAFKSAANRWTLLHTIILVWSLGFTIVAFLIFCIHRRTARLIRRSPTSTNAALLDLLIDCRNQLRIRRRVRLVETDAVTSPALTGVWRPTILLPTSMASKTSLSRDQLRWVLLHELAHIKRHDILISWFALALQAVHWFNPLVWLVTQRMRADREQAADAAVLQAIASDAPDTREQYSRTILQIVEAASRSTRPLAAVGMAESFRSLKGRILAIQSHRKTTKWQTALGLSLLLTLGCTGLTDKQSQQPEIPAVTQGPQNAVEQSVHDLLARVSQLYDERRYEVALEVIDKALALDPDHRVAHAYKGLITEDLYIRRPRPGADGMKVEVREYDVRDLIDKAGIIPGPGMTENDLVQEYVDFIVDQVDPDQWLVNGGLRDTIRNEGTVLYIATTPLNHSEIQQLLERLRNGNAFVDPSENDKHRKVVAEFVETLVMAKLERPIDVNWSEPGVVFRDAIQALRELTSIDYVVNWWALNDASVDTQAPVILNLNGVPANRVLSFILEQTGSDETPLDYIIDENGLVIISTVETLGRNTNARTYDLNDIVANAQKSDFENRERQAIRDELVPEIIALITSTVDPDGWRSNGGKVSSIQQHNGVLIVNTTQENQEVIAALLERLRAGDAFVEPEENETHRKVVVGFNEKIAMDKLDRNVDAIWGEPGVSLREAIQELRKLTSLNIVVNWAALRASGVDTEAKVVLSLLDTPANRVLTLILEQASSDEMPLDYMIDEYGLVIISTVENLGRNTTVRTYDVNHFVAVAQILGVDKREPQAIHDQIVQAIIELITETVDPDSWRSNGGKVGSIQSHNGILIVSTTQENHEEIARVLEQLRKVHGMKISYETHFLLVRPDIYEELGLDMDINPADDSRTAAVDDKPQEFVSAYLNDVQYDFLMKAMQANQAVHRISSPKMLMHNSQHAWIAIEMQPIPKVEVDKIVPKEGKNEAGFQPDVKGFINVMGTINADRKYVTLSLHPTVQVRREGFNKKHVPDPETLQQIKRHFDFVPAPGAMFSAFTTTVSIPDKGRLLLKMGKVVPDVKDENGKPETREYYLLAIIQPTIIVATEQ